MTSKRQSWLEQDYSMNVEVRKSEIDNSTCEGNDRTLKAGNGLFAKQDIRKGDTICLYTGKLIDCADAKRMDPTYVVNFENGRGLKLLATTNENSTSHSRGHIAHFANSVHPAHKLPCKNAKLSLRDKIVTDTNGMKKKLYEVGDKGYFRLKALRNIQKDEEIITNYGNGYWKTMLDWQQSAPKPPTTEESRYRELRLKKRRTEKFMDW